MEHRNEIHASKIAGRSWGLSVSAFFVCALVCGSTLISAVGAQQHQHDSPQYNTYGAPTHLEGSPMKLSEAIQPDNRNKPVRVEAKVSEVCQMKGCWLILTDGEHFVQVTFKDYGFFVPKDIAGKKVVVEGQVMKKILSQAQARHYAEDAGKSQAEIEKIVGDQETLAMVAETVLIPQE